MVIDSDLDLLWLHPLGDVGFMPYLHYLKIAEWIVYHRMLEKNYFLQYITQCKGNFLFKILCLIFGICCFKFYCKTPHTVILSDGTLKKWALSSFVFQPV